MDRISVIVPVYNVAAYLPQCLESILSQDHEDLQVLVVDDGSTDGSGEICDRYAQRDSRIQVIHQKNAGAAAAKNAALRAANGTYLSFVDSDDYLEPGVYGPMLALMKQHQADAAQFNFRDVYKSHTEEQRSWQGQGCMDSRQYLLRFPQDWTCALLWNKLYRREIFDGVFFEEGHKIDDEYFTYRGFLKDRKIVWEDRIVYNYRKRSSSVMASAQAAEQRLLDAADAMDQRRHQVGRAYPELRKDFDKSYVDALWYLSENACQPQTLAVLQKRLRTYCSTPGNALPPRHLWSRLWKLATTQPQKLAREYALRQRGVDSAEYYD